MSKLTRFRCRWLDVAGLAVVERRHVRRVLGIWPVYEWEAVGHFRSVEDGMKWIIDKNTSPASEAGQ